MDVYQEICAKNSAYDIKRIDDPAFKQYGTLWNEFDLTELETFCNKNVKIDSEKSFYVPSNPALEKPDFNFLIRINHIIELYLIVQMYRDDLSNIHKLCFGMRDCDIR